MAADEDPRLLIGDGVGCSVVERNFRDAKSEVGMAGYQTCGWLAWHHHMALVMLTLRFLMPERMRCPKPATPEGPIQITSKKPHESLNNLLDLTQSAAIHSPNY